MVWLHIIISTDNFIKKSLGLVARKKLKKYECILIDNCRSVHTLWMFYSIDAVFLDKNNRILEIFKCLKPFRVTPFIKNAFRVLEFTGGTIEDIGACIGDIAYIKSGN